MNQTASSRTPLGLYGLFALVAVVIRPLPTLLLLPFNFHPVGALAIFGGGRVRTWLAYLGPIAVMVATDCILWAVKGPDYSPLHVSRGVVYGSFLLYVLLGRLLAASNCPLRIVTASLLGSLQFFLLTNIAAWMQYTHLYSRDLSGLLQSLAAGLPFYHYDNPVGFFGFTILSDLFFTGVFFALNAVLTTQTEAVPQEAVAATK